MTVDTPKQAYPSKKESKFLEKGLLTDKLESLKRDKSLNGLTALIIDSVEGGSVFDVFHHLKKVLFNLGTVTIASTLSEAGVKAKAIYEALTPGINYETMQLPDIVGVSSIIGNIDKANKTIKLFNERGAFVVAGGPAYHFTPEIALDAGADVVIQGDGEYTILSLIERLQKQRKDKECLKDVFKRTTLDDILGLYYLRDGKMHYTGPAKLIKNLDESPMLDFGLIERENYRKRALSKVKSIITSMGCFYKCKFCSVRERNLYKYRVKSPGRVIAEVEQALDEGYKEIFFSDDLFLGNPRRVREICNTIINKGWQFNWSTQTRVDNVADNPDVIYLMKKAGCNTLHFGVESIYEEVLQAFGKCITQKDIIEALRIAKENNMYTHAMMVIPADMPREKIEETVRFLIKHGASTAQFCSEAPLPGTESHKELREKGIIIDSINGQKIGYRYYDGQHVVASKTPYESQMNLLHAYDVFYSWSNVKDSLLKRDFRTFRLRLIARGIIRGWKLANRDYLNGLKTGNIEYLCRE
jgi:radical SAM superfamily enzyme YgiQ (UPF0313 family)